MENNDSHPNCRGTVFEPGTSRSDVLYRNHYTKRGRIAFLIIRFRVRIQIVIGIRFTNTNTNTRSSIRIRVFVYNVQTEYKRIVSNTNIRIHKIVFGVLFGVLFD